MVVDASELKDISLCNGKGLVMSLFTDKQHNREPFKLITKRAWHPVRGVLFRDLNVNLFFVEFND